jgi:adenylate cyclase class 2
MAKIEIEVKLRITKMEGIEERLKGIGACLLHSREFEDNQLYDFPDFALKTRGAMLRLRHLERGSILTYKDGGRVESGAKVRDELETAVGDGVTAATILAKLGLRPLFRYQKYRAIYRYSDLLITVDETPIGFFFELEGLKILIDDAAARLGYRPSDYIVKSYFALYRDHLTERGLPFKDMLLENR